MNIEEKELLDKYLNGTASIDEQAKVENLLSSEGVRNIKGYFRKDWNEYFKNNEIVLKDLSGVLDKVHHTIHLKESKSRQTWKRRISLWAYKAAAILIIPLMIAGFFTYIELGKAKSLIAENSSKVSIVSPLGAKYKFLLPDGTKGVLNGGSSVEYPIPFNNSRNVKLIGEAYFDVESDPEHPFTVTANSTEVRVLGTKFNINAFPDSSKTEVILEEGKLECRFKDAKMKATLNPLERIVLFNGKVTKSTVDAEKYTAWKDGKLILHGDSMQELARRLEQWYNVDIEIADKELISYSFRGTFEDDPLEEVLRLLKITSPIKYRIIDKKKLPDNSYSKKKVIFYKRNK